MNLKDLEGSRPNICLEKLRKIMKTAVRISSVQAGIKPIS
jgi:hypothetical protein